MSTIHDFPVEPDAGLLPICSHTHPIPCSPLPVIKLDQASLSTRGDNDDYIRRSRVFIDFEVFMNTVLHVPVDWKTRWGPGIKAIKEDRGFKEHHEQYLQQCINPASSEKSFHEPLTNLTNAIINTLLRRDLGSVISRGFQCHHLQSCLLFGTKHLRWTNPLHVLEAGPYGNTLCDGGNMPRLLIDGVDPISNHAPCHSSSRHDEKKSSTTSSEFTSSKKLPTEGSHTGSEPARKDTESGTESSGHINPSLHVCRYLVERLSGSLLSHATSGLVDRDRLQLYHANHSVILVSSAISFSDGGGLNKFIAFFIASYCLSPEKNGIPDTFVDDNAKPTENDQKLKGS